MSGVKCIPTLTDVLPSSSEARLPPALLVILIRLSARFRLLARGGLIIMLAGLTGGGEPGGDAIAP